MSKAAERVPRRKPSPQEKVLIDWVATELPKRLDDPDRIVLEGFALGSTEIAEKAIALGCDDSWKNGVQALNNLEAIGVYRLCQKLIREWRKKKGASPAPALSLNRPAKSKRKTPMPPSDIGRVQYADPMLLALDYDRTYTRDPDFWDEVIATGRRRGHSFVCVTNRPQPTNTGKAERVPAIPIVCAGEQFKADAARDAGYTVSIWIDDMPASISQTVLLT